MRLGVVIDRGQVEWHASDIEAALHRRLGCNSGGAAEVVVAAADDPSTLSVIRVRPATTPLTENRKVWEEERRREFGELADAVTHTVETPPRGASDTSAALADVENVLGPGASVWLLVSQIPDTVVQPAQGESLPPTGLEVVLAGDTATPDVPVATVASSIPAFVRRSVDSLARDCPSQERP